MFLDPPIQSGASLFLWIVCIIIALIAALSFVDFHSIHGPSDPQPGSEGNDDYWKSRKHAEDVHREFPKEKLETSTDPLSGDRIR
jgi:hypothetical protein